MCRIGRDPYGDAPYGDVRVGLLVDVRVGLLVGVDVRVASFYGDGYVQLKAVESSNRNSLRVRFRTSSPRGLLFLAADHTDYLLLELNSGCLQVKLDLGSGECLLRSESSTQLNDLAWHTAELLHDRHNVTLTVDQHSHTSLRMPGHGSQKQELSIQEGLYIGSSGGLDKLYLPSDLTGFRGCMDEAVFNEHDMLSSLRPYAGFKSVYEVSLGCSPQFFANEEDPVSFFSSRAYVSLPPWNISHVQQEALFECVVHTSAKEGIILYNSARQGGFVAVEIQEGLPVALVGKGGTKTELHSLTFVNDRNWHSIKLFFSPKTLQLTVDKETVKTSISSKGLQLRGSVFVGGIDDSTRTEVRKMGLVSVSGKRVRGGSFKGCLKDMKVNGMKMGLPNAAVTKDISVGCGPEKEPEPSTTMSPMTLPTVPKSHFDPTSVTPTPEFPMSTLDRGLDKRYGMNFVLLRNLVVPEGGRGSLESKHIKVLLDFKKLRIRQSQIMFRIQEQPILGQIRLDVDQDLEENTFSMLDLWYGKVMYIHGGSENPEDFFTFSIFSSSRKDVPDYLKGARRYRYNITVMPTNDAPELSLPQGNLFILLDNSRKHLTTEVLKATDIDSNHTNLIFSVLGNLNTDAGYLEVEDNPGVAVTTFSHSDLNEGKVNYVHTGARNSRIVLRVSDGDKVSNTVVLRIMAIGLEYKIGNNTGLEIIQGEVSVISNKHLAVQTNAVKQVVDIRYDVVEPPQYGELQRLHSSGEWKPTGSFSQRLLEKERLRYLSTFQEIQTANATDYFKCKVTVAGRVDTELVFPITVKWVHYNLVRNVMADIDKVRKVTLDSQYLYATVDVVTLSEDDLHFRVLSSPKKGQLLLVNELLKKNSTFSQRNVTDRKVQYELVDRPYEDTSDTFKFHVFSKHAQTQSYNFQISIKADVNSIFIRNDGLLIKEGESKLITKAELFAETLSTKEMYYTVTSSPKHGNLQRINLSNSNTSYNIIQTFSNQDLLEERVMYIHDDTETTQDQFTFIASTSQESKSSVTDDEVGSKEGTFNISIQLVNDEKPVRVVDKVFHVVRDGQRLLTLDDLCYHDADSDFSDGQLVYTRRGIPMGDLVLVNDTSHRLFQFTQKELEEKRVLFLHRGVSSGRFVLFVSDRKHFVSTLLDVTAEDPFLRLGNNTGLFVQKGKEVTLTTGNFSVLTNLDIRDDSEVTYKVSEPPRNGGLYRHGNISMQSFTQRDLKKGLVSYRHDDRKNPGDSFNVTVKVKGTYLNARVNVKVYLDSHQRPPILQHNNTLLVEESTPVKIDQSRLEVIHENNMPSEIVFTVKVAPLHGFIRRFVETEDQYVGTGQTPVQTFSQEDVNAGNIQYMQTAPGQVNDTFLLDVSNGVTEVNNISMSVDIIAHLIPLQVLNFTLREGGSKALTQEVLRVTSRHFSGLNFLYSLSEPPQNGHIEHSRYPGVPLRVFTRRQVEQGVIYYIHDSSETLEDNFTVVANDTGLRKQSSPCTVYIQVTAVNDQHPVITANRVLRVWERSVTEIRPENLDAQDEDTPPEELQVIATPPNNGHLALKSAPTRPLLNCTLQHIHLGQLVFVHSGAMSGGFNFQVNDGVNFSPRQIFSITASTLVLSLENNQPLKVFPGSTTPITRDDLQAVTNDKRSNRTITFNVIRRPELGRLVTVLANNYTVDVSSFTQTMVDQGEVLYFQSFVESVGWSAMDSMTFSVFSPPVTLETQTFEIDISYENAGTDRKSLLLANTGAVVTEGDSVVIDESKLDASNLMFKLPTPQRNSHEVWFQVKSLPQHGVIVVGERNLSVEKPNFSQRILNKYGITYRHDDSETRHDSFVFDTWLNPKGKPAQRPLDVSQVLEEWFNITVVPINDQPPVLKTKTPSLSVVQGDTVALGLQNLNVKDLDNPSEDIQYTVVSKPNNGYLALGGSLNESVVSFTQAQINSGKVYFVHDGNQASGVFYFSISDGHHEPVYKLFNLELTEITISLVNNTGLTLKQGQTCVALTQGSLAAETNGKTTTVHYRITKLPRYGKILWLDNQDLRQFEQEDLRTGRLFYQMTSVTSGQDSFEFTVFTSEAHLTNQVVNITVKPLVRFGKGVRIPNGIVVKLNAGFLNATELASLTGNDPVFEVVSQPKYGKLARGKAKAGMKTEPVEAFSFQDVKQERISIELNANMTEEQELNDSLVFVVKAENVPPAKGEFLFTVVPYDPSLVRRTESPVLNTSSLFSQSLNQTNQTTVFGIGATLPSLSTSSKTHQKFKGRNHWGNTNRNDSTGTTLGKPTMGRGEDLSEIPFMMTPVRVESYPQRTYNPLLVILPLLVLLLLVIILVVLFLLLRRNRKRKQKPLTLKPPPSPSPPLDYHDHPQRSAAAPTVMVTPLSPGDPGSPALDRPLPFANRGSVSNSASLPDCSLKAVNPESSDQLIRTPTPTLQQNQYWV
ncbi:chondroitin sulfate proteoglycan 4-like [Oncorhynchus masou masou]|uniref:chondroitin sulfate proteoglycan 4-like n=1 Tax=Oncorhynchus masou masou TaxID=90313 RepID=UPI003183F380